MKKRTLHKILQDPDFDPAIFLEEAIVNFINQHPVKVAEDKVALRHLVSDSDVAANVFQLVDINDLDLVKSYLTAIPGMNYNQAGAVEIMTAKLGNVKEENVGKMLEMIKESIGKIYGLDTPKSLKHLAPIMVDDDIDKMMTIMLGQAKLESWQPDDWEVAIKTKDGQKALLKTLPKVKILEVKMFQLISRLGTALEGTQSAKELLEVIRAKWSTYICFKCGKGKGPYKPHTYSRKNRGTNDFIKSISGYTLHRKGCDKENEFLSPHEIINGRPMKLKFECELACGATFTTLSGKTLHEKSCKF